jgi:hypothetical protein
MARSNPDGAHLSADDGQDEPQDQIMLGHGPPLDYKVVNGNPFVLVPWFPTWEPPENYSRGELERVKRLYESRTRRKRRGRPPLRVVGSK